MFEPTLIKHALVDPLSKSYMQLEFDVLVNNDTWTLIPTSTNRKIIINR